MKKTILTVVFCLAFVVGMSLVARSVQPPRDSISEVSVEETPVVELTTEELALVQPPRDSISEVSVEETPVVELTTEELALDMMHFPACRCKLSAARQKVVASQIGRTLDSLSSDKFVKRVYVLQLCIESAFNPAARSPAGARGIAQIMPGTAADLAKKLGYGEVKNEDLEDVELSLRLGFSYLLSLVETYKGNVAKAVAAYNAGPASSTVKQMTYLGRGNLETGWYVANIFNLIEERKMRCVARETHSC